MPTSAPTDLGLGVRRFYSSFIAHRLFIFFFYLCLSPAVQFTVKVGSYVLAGSVILGILLLITMIWCKYTDTNAKAGFQRVPTEEETNLVGHDGRGKGHFESVSA